MRIELTTYALRVRSEKIPTEASGTRTELETVSLWISRSSATMLHHVGVPSSVKDPTTSFRVYSRSAIEASHKKVTDLNGDVFFGGMIAVPSSEGAKIREVLIQFRPRWAGKSKMKLARIVETANRLPSIRIRTKMLKCKSEK